jgi:Rod binding domain-containing protein
MESGTLASVAFSQPSFPVGTVGNDRLEELSARASHGKTLSASEMEEVGKQFEGLLLNQLLSAMRKTVPESELFGKSSAEQIYMDMFDEKVASEVSQSGQTGISDMVVEELKRQQQSQSPPAEGPVRFYPLASKENILISIVQQENMKPVPRNTPIEGPLSLYQDTMRPLKTVRAAVPEQPLPRTSEVEKE